MNNAGKNNNSIKKPPILRVADIIPAHHDGLIQESQKQKANNGLQNNQDTPENKTTGETNYKIPKFNVAEQILANQRRTSSMKRLSPARHKDTGAQEHTPQTSQAVSPVRQDITVIKEIVRRDIESFCQYKLVYE